MREKQKVLGWDCEKASGEAIRSSREGFTQQERARAPTAGESMGTHGGAAAFSGRKNANAFNK